MISQVMLGDRTHRTIEDIDETVLNAAQMKAIASGDPLIMERATLEAELQGLGMQLQAYNDNPQHSSFLHVVRNAIADDYRNSVYGK